MLVGTLAERLMLRPHTTTELVDRMAQQGLVERSPGIDDQRQVDIKITAKGARILISLSTAHRAELRRIRPLLNHLIENL